MPIMTWDNTLDVGVPEMNEDHQEILDAMNAVYDAHTAGKSGDAMNVLVEKLGKVCVQHFTDEEAFMKRCNFPGLATHKIMHAHLLEKFGSHAQAIKAAGGKTNEAFFQFLRFWLSSHIRGVDTKYGAHANGSPITRAAG